MRPEFTDYSRAKAAAAAKVAMSSFTGQDGKPVAMTKFSPRVAALYSKRSRVDDRAVLETYRACGNTAEMLKTLQHRAMPKMYRPVVQHLAPAHTRPGVMRYSLALACQWGVDVGVAVAAIFVGCGHKGQGTLAYVRSSGCGWVAIAGAYVLLGCVIVVPMMLLP